MKQLKLVDITSGETFFPSGQGAASSTIPLVAGSNNIAIQSAAADPVVNAIKKCPFIGIKNNGHTQVLKVLNYSSSTGRTTFQLDSIISEFFAEDVFDVFVFAEPVFCFKKIEITLYQKPATTLRINEYSAVSNAGFGATHMVHKMETDRPIALNGSDAIIAIISKYS